MQLGFEPLKERDTTSAAGAVITLDGTGTAYFKWLTPPYEDGYYDFRRWKIMKTVQLGNSYETPIAWGRIQQSLGWRKIEDVDGGIYDKFWVAAESPGYVHVDDVTANSLTLVTYCYDLFCGQDTVPMPCRPGDAWMSYTVVESANAASVPDFTAPLAREGIEFHPNPSGHSITLVLQGVPDEARRTIEILSVDGRVVRRLRALGGQELQWDLRDEDGIPIPAGIYFARCSETSQDVPKKLVVIR
jgi:hypothetical protein